MVALRYMKLSLKSDRENKVPLSHLASTKLNICAVLSSLSRHSEARHYAKEAIQELEQVLIDFDRSLQERQD